MLQATVNEATMVPFVSQQLNNLDLALSLALRGNLPGAENLIGQQFEKLFAAGQFKEAAECAADSPKGVFCAALLSIMNQDEGYGQPVYFFLFGMSHEECGKRCDRLML